MERNKNTDWFSESKYGIFVHYLNQNQNNKERELSMGKETSWDECVKEFDTDLFARCAFEAGAAYVMFTIMQLSRHMIAPNETYDKITGYKPGEACATRDLIEDLYQSLNKYDIKLMLYFTGDGPAFDEIASKAFDIDGTANENFRKKWQSVAREYSLKYGKKIVGWWVDGMHLEGYTDETREIFADDIRAGNSESIVCFNPGNALMDVRYYTAADDYTAGERDHLEGQYPKDRWLNGRQWHCLSPLGDRWSSPNAKYTAEELIDQITKVSVKKGVITLDVGVYRNGEISPEQMPVLKKLKKAFR